MAELIMANDILSIVELTSEHVICSVNVTDPLQVAKNPAYGVNDAYITIDREYERSVCDWDGLRVTFVDKDGNSSTVRAFRTTGVKNELVRSIIGDVERLVRQRGLSLYGKSMKPYKIAQVSAVYGGRWWGTLYDEYGKELNVRCVGKQGQETYNSVFMRMLDDFNIPYYGKEFVTRYDAYSGPRPTTNCTYYIYDVDEATRRHSEAIEQED